MLSPGTLSVPYIPFTKLTLATVHSSSAVVPVSHVSHLFATT